MHSPPTERLLSDKIYDELLALLGTKGFEPQTRMPGENALSQRFGVSRPVLRQALGRLRAEGRIYARKGSGNYVGDLDVETPVVSFGPLKSIPDVRRFLEFRCSVEGEIAALAAVHREPADMDEIRRCRAHYEAALQRGETGIDEDIAYHASIAQACGNRFFAMTMAALEAQTRFSINLVRGLSAADQSASRLATVCDEHSAIEAAIAAGDAQAARAAMGAHLRGGIARLFER